MSMTVKELAEACGVSKVTILNRLNAQNLRSECTKEGNRLIVPDSIVKTLTEAYKGKSEAHSKEATNSERTPRNQQEAELNESQNLDSKLELELRAQIEQLTDSLRIINKELEAKNKHIEKLLDDNRQLIDDNRYYMQINSQLLLTGSINNHDPEPMAADFTEAEAEEEAPKKSFLSKLLRR